MSDEPTTAPKPPPAEAIFGIILYLYNPLAPHITPLVGESGRQYLFQRLPEHGERHVHICGSIAEYRAIRLDLLGENDRLARHLGYQLGVDFMTEKDQEAKLAREAAEAEKAKAAAYAAQKEYRAGLSGGIRDNTKTIVRIKAKRETLARQMASTAHGPTLAPMYPQLESLDKRLGHLAANFDRMMADHKEHHTEAEHEALRSEAQAIFDGAAPDAGAVALPMDAGPVGSPSPRQKTAMAAQGASEPEPTPVVLPPDLVIRDRLPDDPEVSFGPMAPPPPADGTPEWANGHREPESEPTPTPAPVDVLTPPAAIHPKRRGRPRKHAAT